MSFTLDAQGQATVRVPWDRLREWIDDHAAEERSTLTETQLKAISQLVPFIIEEPHETNTDYVSALNRKLLLACLANHQLTCCQFTSRADSLASPGLSIWLRSMSL